MLLIITNRLSNDFNEHAHVKHREIVVDYSHQILKSITRTPAEILHRLKSCGRGLPDTQGYRGAV